MKRLRAKAAHAHAVAKHHFIKALKALKRSKAAAIAANNRLHKHAIEGMKKGHI